MTPAVAAATYLELRPIQDAIAGRLAQAEKTLKAFMAERTTTTAYKGITVSTGASERFSQSLAKELLGKRAAEAMVFTPSMSLVLPARLRKGAVELRAELVPVTPAAATG